MAGFHHSITTWQGGAGGDGVCLRAAAWYRTTLRNKDRTFDSTFPTVPERRGSEPEAGTSEASWTHVYMPHQAVDDINPWEARPVVMTIVEFCM